MAQGRLIRDCVPNWIEWHLALYRLMEQLEFTSCVRKGISDAGRSGQAPVFRRGPRDAAEQMLMKILFPLNQ